MEWKRKRRREWRYGKCDYCTWNRVIDRAYGILAGESCILKDLLQYTIIQTAKAEEETEGCCAK